MSIAFIRADSLYAWKGSSLLITTARGDCASDVPIAGYYFREARFCRTLRIAINGKPPWLCEAALDAPDQITVTYVHPEITKPGGGGSGQSGDEEETDDHGLPVRALDIRVTYVVRAAQLEAALAITNRSRRPVEFTVTCAIDADFADIQEAHSMGREQHAGVRASVGGEHIAFTYEHPRLAYRSDVHLGDGWTVVSRDTTHQVEGLEAHVTLPPQQTRDLGFRIVPFVADEALSDEDVAEREAALERWRAAFTRVTVPGNRLLERIFLDNVRDFASFPMLDGNRREWMALQAGMPLYPAFFGRDAITAGWQAALLDRGQSLDASLARLSRLQSDRFDDWRDEEPGRVPYQVRSGPLALLDLNPYSAYYADFASPLMFVIALANLYAWTGELAIVRPYWDTARRILDWARTLGDPDHDGYLEYQTRSARGTKNQGWKDSGDAIIYEDGSPVPSPIATCEIQGYWYIAQELMGLLSVVMGARNDAAGHHASAAALRERFNRDWWVAEEQCFALALDPEKRRVRAVTSNVGHCLATGIIDAEHRPPVVGRLFAPDMFSGWGIRTLSAAHALYDPLSYHRGTIWAVEQATIVFGLRRFGFDARALELARTLFDLAQLYPEHRIPECVGGHPRGERSTPGVYPRANTPQLWNATAFPLALQSILGLIPLAPLETLVIDPVLPSWMPEVEIRGLRVGRARVSLRVWRDSSGTSKWDVLHKHGTLHVVRQPPPESNRANWADRLRGLVETLGG